MSRFDDDVRGDKGSAFSIQNIVYEGLEFGKLPGDWYGINNVSMILEMLNSKYQPVDNFMICVLQEGSIVIDFIEAMGTYIREVPLKDQFCGNKSEM